VKFLSQQVALLRNRQFLLARFQALVFDGHAKMMAKRFQQVHFLIGQRLRTTEIEVIDAEFPLVAQDAESGRRGEALADAGAQFHARWRGDRSKRRRSTALENVTAQAVAAIHFRLAFDKFFGQALTGHQTKLVRRRHVQADRPRIGPQRRNQAIEKAFAQAFQRRRFAQKSRDGIENAQFVIALGQAAGFRLDALFEGAVGALQVLGHPVETAGQATEFVIAGDRQPNSQVVRQSSAACRHGFPRPDG
jgi:hypothetical protein